MRGGVDEVRSPSASDTPDQAGWSRLAGDGEGRLPLPVMEVRGTGCCVGGVRPSIFAILCVLRVKSEPGLVMEVVDEGSSEAAEATDAVEVREGVRRSSATELLLPAKSEAWLNEGR